ncbi:MAG: hypothetical protein LBG84_05185 [Treponema sp.]|jgi:hypothetical protein|nr:hypothetical protein [Treponema sp.]
MKRSGTLLSLILPGLLAIPPGGSAQAVLPPPAGLESRPILPPVPADARVFPETGDAAIARRYVEWARGELAVGRTAEARAGLERGADYGAASSDLCYLLALVRFMTGPSRYPALEACRRALETARWERYGPGDARLLEARVLIELRRFDAALEALGDRDGEQYETRYERLRALRGLARSRDGGSAEGELLGELEQTMDRFPRKTGPVRLLFEYARDSGGGALSGEGGLRALLDTALRRLPVLAAADPELAFLGAPFIRDQEEARRYVAAYRAMNRPSAASLPAALNLGLIGEKEAAEELFGLAGPARRGGDQNNRADPAGQLVLDRTLIAGVWGLLRSEGGREFFRRNLLSFSGVIIEDRDGDGIVEVRVLYHEGMIRSYSYDADQDGVPDLSVVFVQGAPSTAEAALADFSGGGEFILPLDSGNRRRALFRWERYPAVLEAELDGVRYLPRPLDYFFKPLDFITLIQGGPDYPELEEPPPLLTGRSLLSFAVVMERPSGEFKGGMERIELVNGVPVKAAVYVGGRLAAETEYRLGRPLIQRLDLDLDGRMETIRRYDPAEPGGLLLSESDWDGDGNYEYAEIPQENGGVRKTWDLDGDGARETER